MTPDSPAPAPQAPPPSPKGWSRSFVDRQVKRILGPLARTCQFHGTATPCGIIFEKGDARMVLSRASTWFLAFDAAFLAPGRAREKAAEEAKTPAP